MILDKELEMVTGVALDLGDPGKRSDGSTALHGPGRQVHLQIQGISAGTVDITTGDTSTSDDALITVVCPVGEVAEAHLPSTCKRYIKATFADGSIDVILDSAQTNR
jgi:hypothetical protein